MRFLNWQKTRLLNISDEALRKFTGLMKNQIRRNQDYAFRYGGEEFAILLSSPTLETAERFSAKIIRTIESMDIPHKGSPYGRLTVSISGYWMGDGLCSMKSSTAG